MIDPPMCVNTKHVYGTADICLTCFENAVRADERSKWNV